MCVCVCVCNVLRLNPLREWRIQENWEGGVTILTASRRELLADFVSLPSCWLLAELACWAYSPRISSSPACPGDTRCPRGLYEIQPGFPSGFPAAQRQAGVGGKDVVQTYLRSLGPVSCLLPETWRELVGGCDLTHLTLDSKRFVETSALPTSHSLPIPLALRKQT